MDSVRHNHDAELALLGAVLQKNHAIHVARSLVAAEDFHHPAHAAVWNAMLALAATEMPIDRVTLADELRRSNRFNTVSAAVKLDELEFFGLSDNVEGHARIVAGLAVARRIEAAARNIVLKARDPRVSVTELAEFATASLSDASRRQDQRAPKSMMECAEEFYAELVRTRERGPGISGLTTGLADLDALTAGLHPGQLVILAARPAMGKSSLAMGMARATAEKDGKPVLVFSLEMARLELFTRLACAKAGVEQTLLRHNAVGPAEFERITTAVGNLARLPVWIDDNANTTLFDVAAQCRRTQAAHGLGAVFVDYLQLMAAARGKGRTYTREQEVAEMSRGLKVLAKELGVPVIALSQLSRKCEERQDKRPMLSDLRDSGAIEQDADVVMFIYRDEVYNPPTDETRGVAEIIVAKQRSGPPDTARVKWVGPLTQFENAEREYERTHPSGEYRYDEEDAHAAE
jgi:replicative DNA helicase